jgi:hypothetical protein
VSGLAEFLLARIAEDEADARKAESAFGSTQWGNFDDDEAITAISPQGDGYVATGPYNGGIGRPAAHIARWDPARVLAECEAKRRIIMWHGDRNDCWFNSHGEPCDHLTALALPYADHPSFQPEWKS